MITRRSISPYAEFYWCRGLFGGTWISASSNVIDYVTIASTGNATDFGDLTICVQFAV